MMKKYKIEWLYGGLFFLIFLTFEKLIGVLELSHRVHLLLFTMSFIVFGIIFLLRFLGKYDVIGFSFLGTVIFKAFGLGYLVLFEPDIKYDLMIYFVVFWVYLVLESLYTVACIKIHDKNHIN